MSDERDTDAVDGRPKASADEAPAAGLAGDGDDGGAAERQSFVRHELRTPLAVLRPVIDLLRDGSAGHLKKRQRENIVEMLDRNAARLEAMIVSPSPTAAGSRWRPCRARDDLVSLDEVVAEAIATLPRQPGRSPRFDVNAAPCDVRGDHECLQRALRNVLLNACVASPPHGEIRVLAQVDVDAGVARVTVSDTGPGMPADELANAFDFGFQGRSVQARPDRGLGIGLFVTRALVAEHGGRVARERRGGRHVGVRRAAVGERLTAEAACATLRFRRGAGGLGLPPAPLAGA